MKYFLLVYDRPRGELVEDAREFWDHLDALRARFELERSDRNPDHEIVVITGDDLDSLKTTHSRYFASLTELIPA